MTQRTHRPWDKAINPSILKLVRDRRVTPDGIERFAKSIVHRGKGKYLYPWNEMQVGDFFVVRIVGSKDAMIVHFRQTAARKDVELSVRVWDVDGEKALRVTKVLDGVNQIKDKAGVKRMNVKARIEYHKKYRKDNAQTAKEKRAVIDLSEPTELVIDNQVETNHDLDYKAILAERRRKALLEASGMDLDDPDFMGVANNEKDA
jgi:hypothetical protein